MHFLFESISTYKSYNLNEFFYEIKNYKRDKIIKYVNYQRKKQSILGEHLLKKGLAEFYNLEYNGLYFKINKNGKPYIINKNIFYNISHSFDYVVCVFSNKKIGVDIEKIRDINIKCVSQFATKKEINYIFKDSIDINKRFFEIYTLKEAYFKMKGSNLNNIKNIEFNIDNNNNVLCSDHSVKMELYTKINNYIVSFCKQYN